jgi:hypothetical protein
MLDLIRIRFTSTSSGNTMRRVGSILSPLKTLHATGEVARQVATRDRACLWLLIQPLFKTFTGPRHSLRFRYSGGLSQEIIGQLHGVTWLRATEFVIADIARSNRSGDPIALH